MKISIIVQRYGADFVGGAESHARFVAERLTPFYDVEVLTSCAQDYHTWENYYASGKSELNGVTIHRFPVAKIRPPDFPQIADNIYRRPHTFADEIDWVRAQGPLVPDLVDHLKRHRDESDVFIFFTYLYYPTAMGLKLVADKAILVPTAHDEGPIYLDFYRSLFHAPRAILYNIEEERAFVQRRFGNGYLPNAIAGVGVDVARTPDPNRFRQPLGLDKPYFLYLGRITEHKNCDELVAFYRHYQQTHLGEADLVMVGKGEMPLPDLPGLVYGGFLNDVEKFDAIAGAEAIVMPSRFESMSMIVLEAWMLGKPVVCTAQCAVVRDMVRRAHGGLYYANAAEFSEILHRLTQDRPLAQTLGRQGQTFVQSTYTWPKVISTYRRFINDIASNPWR